LIICCGKRLTELASLRKVLRIPGWALGHLKPPSMKQAVNIPGRYLLPIQIDLMQALRLCDSGVSTRDQFAGVLHGE